MRFLPNILTVARIILTPVLLVLLLSGTFAGQSGALVLFILAAVSDYWDGHLARRYEAGSRLGQFLDPFADKVLVLGTFATLSFMLPTIVPWWAVALIAVRDIAVTLLRMWAEVRGRTLRTLPMAKTKTALQLTFLIGILVMLVARHPYMPEILIEVAHWVLSSLIPFVLLMTLVAVTLFTGVWYFVNQEFISSAKLNG